MALIFGRGSLGITTTELAELVGVRDTAVVVRALQNALGNAQDCGLNPDEILVRRPNGQYVAGQALLQLNLPEP